MISSSARPNSRRVPAFDLAAERGHHGLLAIADAEHRHAGIEHRLRRLRRARLMHAGRPAGEDDGPAAGPAERRLGLVERHDFGIDAGLAHPPRDELGHLAAEIDDQHAVLLRLGPHDGDGYRECGRRGSGGFGRSIGLGLPPRSRARSGVSVVMAGGYSSAFALGDDSPALLPAILIE